MSRNIVSPMHGALVKKSGRDSNLLAEVAEGVEKYIDAHGLPVPRSVRKKPMDEYWVFLPNDRGYENVATHYAFRYPKSFLTMDGNRYVIRTYNYSDLAAITGTLHVSGNERLCRGKETIEDYFEDGVDVIKAPPRRQY